MKLGDLVRCDCEIDTWYKGKMGLVVDFCSMKNPWVLYPSGKVVRLAGSALEVIT